jgi:hypothetical protein
MTHLPGIGGTVLIDDLVRILGDNIVSFPGTS